LYSLQRSCFN